MIPLMYVRNLARMTPLFSFSFRLNTSPCDSLSTLWQLMSQSENIVGSRAIEFLDRRYMSAPLGLYQDFS